MAKCVCGTLHSPVRHHLHHCLNPDCKRVTVRDKCAMVIGVIGDVKILQRKVVLAGGRNGDLRELASQIVLIWFFNTIKLGLSFFSQ
jgi:hypothetical protein